MNEYQKYILGALTNRELLEQLAEEASELSQAALKVIRAKGLSNNPTPVNECDAYSNLKEELYDVLAVASLLGIVDYDDNDNHKWERWAKRLGKR
jgi:NTP pyrophosphatase (non-canonical NTP hydrolase)